MMARTLREWIEWGQPSPREVARDARKSIPPEELKSAAEAQDVYTPEELAEAAFDFSRAIISKLGLKTDDVIKDRYPVDNGSVTHHHLPYGNHRWTISEASSPTRRVLEVRTGPFLDDATKKDYEPEIKVTILNGSDPLILPSGRNAYREGLMILSEVMPALPPTHT